MRKKGEKKRGKESVTHTIPQTKYSTQKVHVKKKQLTNAGFRMRCSLLC